MFLTIGVLNNFAKFTEKRLCRSLFCKESKNFKVEFENSDKAGRIISVTVETQKKQIPDN